MTTRVYLLKMSVAEIFEGSNGDATSELYKHLAELGPVGLVVLNLFRACKNSGRAKVYRGRGFKDAAYERKAYSMKILTNVLEQHGEALRITWGWKKDPNQPHFPWVLYVDTPHGQVSFHHIARLSMREYPGQWDQMTHSPSRIVKWATELLNLAPKAAANFGEWCGALATGMDMASTPAEQQAVLQWFDERNPRNPPS